MAPELLGVYQQYRINTTTFWSRLYKFVARKEEGTKRTRAEVGRRCLQVDRNGGGFLMFWVVQWVVSFLPGL